MDQTLGWLIKHLSYLAPAMSFFRLSQVHLYILSPLSVADGLVHVLFGRPRSKKYGFFSSWVMVTSRGDTLRSVGVFTAEYDGQVSSLNTTANPCSPIAVERFM